MGRLPKVGGNINAPQNIELKRTRNNNWYHNKGHLISKIKSLIKKYDIDINVEYNHKTPDELNDILQKLKNWIVINCPDLLF